MLNKNEVIWSSGLFEGEGCITHNSSKQKKVSPKLVLVMKEEFSVLRFYAAIGHLGYIYFRPKTKCWEWRVNGFEKFQAVLAIVWSGLGPSRKKRAREILSAYHVGTPVSRIHLVSKDRTVENLIKKFGFSKEVAEKLVS